MLGYASAAVMFVIAVGAWLLPLAKWKYFSRRSRAWLTVAMPAVSLCASLWVFAIVYTALGGDLGWFGNEAAGRRTAIGQIVRIAFFSGFGGIVSGGAALRNTGEGRIAAVPVMGLIALGWWMFWAGATY